MKKFLNRVAKFNFQEFLNGLRGVVIANKSQIITGVIAFVIIFFGSFFVEYYGFGYKILNLEKADIGISVIQNSTVANENFKLNDQGLLVSQTENASFDLATQGRFVQNLELDLGENPDYGISIKYLDPKTNQEVLLQNKLQKSMKKNGFTFLHFAVFKIENNPESITIFASSPQTLVSSIRIDNSYHFNPYRCFFVFAIGILLLSFFALRKKIGKNPEVGFFVVAMICGTLLSFSEPLSYISWDEAIHYGRANDHSIKNIPGNNVADIFGKTNSVPSSYSLKEQNELNKYFDNLQSKPSKSKKSKNFSFFNFSLIDFYTQIVCIPSGLALTLGRILHFPNHLIFIFGRWINVLVFSSVVFFAIKKLKTGKMIMSVVALFPTSIFLASNYGYDFWVTGFTMLGMAYFFSELQQPEKKTTGREMAIMIGAFVVGLGPKAIYFPLLALLFLLPRKKFESLERHKKFVWVSALSLLFLVGSFMLPFVIGGPGKGDKRGGELVNSAQQVKFILSDPVTYSKILFTFMSGYIDPRNGEGFTNSFAYLGTAGGFWIVFVVLVVATFTDKNKYDKQTSDLKTKLWVIGICLATVALICTALYVAFTPVRSVTIAGVQYRYLIPLVFPFLFVIGSSCIRNPFNKNVYNSVIFAVLAAVLLSGIWELIAKLHY